MEARKRGGNTAVLFTGTKWEGRAQTVAAGVPAGSFVPSDKNFNAGTLMAQEVKTVPISGMSDEELILLFQKGEEHVYRILVERYQERIRNLLYSIFHEQNIIEDLAQEVFIKAYQALPRFRSESTFYTWLYRIAVNKGRDEIRRRKLRRFLSLQTLDEGIDNEIQMKMSVAPENRDDHELIALGLKTLPEKFRTAVILKDIDGLPYDEIAKIMECEVGTVKSRISRGRTMLRKALEPLVKEARL
jgi:RNA polymerase sigma-70 factor, ECF subfamily